MARSDTPRNYVNALANAATRGDHKIEMLAKERQTHTPKARPYVHTRVDALVDRAEYPVDSPEPAGRAR